MPTLELPEDVYEALAQRAEKDQRTVEEQAIAELAKPVEIDGRARRQAVIARVRSRPPLPADALDPVELIREDRDR
jgi:hypothetical protein